MRSLSLLVTVSLALVACKPGEGGTVEPKTDDQKTFYALGYSMSQRLQVFNLKGDELAMVIQGMKDGVAGKKASFEINTYGMKLNQLAQARAKDRLGEEKKAAGAFLEAAAKETGAEKTPSGLVYKVITEGSGESPKATDRVKVHYHGTLRDGKVFDSSVDRKEPATFSLNGVVPCWTEGVQKMKVGGKAKLTCPAEIAYGDQGRPGIPPGAPLTFEVELISIEPAAPASPGPGMSMPPGGHGMPPGGPGAHGMPPGGPGHGPPPSMPVKPGTPTPPPAAKPPDAAKK